MADFIIKNNAASNIKLQQLINNLRLGTGNKLKYDKFASHSAQDNLDPRIGTHWVCSTENQIFDSYGCAPPESILNYVKTNHGKCVFSE